MVVSVKTGMYEGRKAIAMRISDVDQDLDDQMIVAMLKDILESEGLRECVLVEESLQREDDKMGMIFYVGDEINCECDDCRKESTSAVDKLLDELKFHQN